jgi:hypothetical protein
MDNKKSNIKNNESSELPQIIKITLAILGGTNLIFSIFMPIAIALMINKFYDLNIISRFIVIIAGCFSSIYRAFDVGGIETLEYFFEKFKRN